MLKKSRKKREKKTKYKHETHLLCAQMSNDSYNKIHNAVAPSVCFETMTYGCMHSSFVLGKTKQTKPMTSTHTLCSPTYTTFTILNRMCLVLIEKMKNIEKFVKNKHSTSSVSHFTQLLFSFFSIQLKLAFFMPYFMQH